MCTELDGVRVCCANPMFQPWSRRPCRPRLRIRSVLSTRDGTAKKRSVLVADGVKMGHRRQPVSQDTPSPLRHSTSPALSSAWQALNHSRTCPQEGMLPQLGGRGACHGVACEAPQQHGPAGLWKIFLHCRWCVCSVGKLDKTRREGGVPRP